MFELRKAEKKDQFLRLAIDGVSGSGKTYTALAIATAIAKEAGGRIALIDSEERSSELYADDFDFDVVPFDAPFSPERYRNALGVIGDSDIHSVGIVDSLSHAWFGEGGELEMKDNESRKVKGNTYVAWRNVTPEHNKLIESMLRFPGHLIVTMRSKTDYVIEDGKPRKIGLKPIMREGLEYEFQIVGTMDLDNVMTISKSRCQDVNGGVFKKPGADFAKVLWTWLHGSGEEFKPEVRKATAPPESDDCKITDLDDDEKARLKAIGITTPAKFRHRFAGKTKSEVMAEVQEEEQRG